MPHHKPMVPPDFIVPEHVATDDFIIRTLLASDAEADYEAWHSSLDHLQGVFGPTSSWPPSSMTVEGNFLDLAWHQREHEARSTFGYTVFDPTDTRCLGCIYLSPPQKVAYDVEVYYWVRASEVPKGLDGALGRFVREWVNTDWPFTAPAYPGRDISWEAFVALEARPHW